MSIYCTKLKQQQPWIIFVPGIFMTFLGSSSSDIIPTAGKAPVGKNEIPDYFFPSVDKTFKYLLHMLTYKMENPINAVDLATVSSWNCSQLL